MFLPSHLHNGSGSDQKYWLRPAPAPQHCSDTSPGHEFKHIFEYFSKTRPKILYFILQHLQKILDFFTISNLSNFYDRFCQNLQGLLVKVNLEIHI